MPSIINIPTEQTTAATDFILFLLSFSLIIFIYLVGWKRDRVKAKIWIALFSFLSLAALLGAIAHGFQMKDITNFIICQPLNVLLGLAISMFVVAVVYDWKKKFYLSFLILMLALVAGFYVVTLLFSGAFLVFIIFEGISMIYALGLYLFLSVKRKLTGAVFMFIGVLITIIAAMVQASENVYLDVIWQFDFNGIFHILQMIALIFFAIGLNFSFKYTKLINNKK